MAHAVSGVIVRETGKEVQTQKLEFLRLLEKKPCRMRQDAFEAQKE